MKILSSSLFMLSVLVVGCGEGALTQSPEDQVIEAEGALRPSSGEQRAFTNCLGRVENGGQNTATNALRSGSADTYTFQVCADSVNLIKTQLDFPPSKEMSITLVDPSGVSWTQTVPYFSNTNYSEIALYVGESSGPALQEGAWTAIVRNTGKTSATYSLYLTGFDLR